MSAVRRSISRDGIVTYGMSKHARGARGALEPRDDRRCLRLGREVGEAVTADMICSRTSMKADELRPPVDGVHLKWWEERHELAEELVTLVTLVAFAGDEHPRREPVEAHA